MVRRRSLGRSSGRPVGGRRPLAHLHRLSVVRRAGDSRLPGGQRQGVLRPAGGADLCPAVRTAGRRFVAAGDSRTAQPLPSRFSRAPRHCSNPDGSIQSPSTSIRSHIGSRPAAASGLSVSPCYWPLAWPSPEPVTLTLHLGQDSELVLPTRPARAEDGPPRPPIRRRSLNRSPPSRSRAGPEGLERSPATSAAAVPCSRSTGIWVA